MTYRVSSSTVPRHLPTVEEYYTPLMKVAHDNVVGDGMHFDGPFGRRSVSSGIVPRHLPNAEEYYTPLMKVVHDNVVGDGMLFEGPFGRRSVLYCDYTASGRPLAFIENYINEEVMNTYANTHTNTCITARQTSTFRHDAKDIIRRCVNGGPDDMVIFVGSGTTAAVHKLVSVLKQTERKDQKTVVFVTAFEHHSNLLPWMEAGFEVVSIKEARNGSLDMEDLKQKLEDYKNSGKRLMASFNAASNITGIITDTVAVAELLHKYGVYSFWDFATAAPYLDIDMNATPTGYKDAIFCSPHKFVGGPGTPGLLIAKRHLFQNEVPHGAGGGTVLYVISDKHKYLADIEIREEGGTPAIIESIRAGIVFQLKQCLGQENIEAREEFLYRRAKGELLKLKNLIILGSGSVARLPIFSFLIWNPETKKYLHHNFIASVLNDLFGIQSRAGCSCAGPYAECLLGIDGHEYVPFLEDPPAVNVGGCGCADRGSGNSHHAMEVMKPGFVRLNFAYFMTEVEFQFALKALAMVAKHGWRLLPQYTVNMSTGEWRHRKVIPEPRSLKDLSFGEHGIELQKDLTRVQIIKNTPKVFKGVLKEANKVFVASSLCAANVNFENDENLQGLADQGNEGHIWFLEPRVAALHVVTSDWTASAESKHMIRSFYSNASTRKRSQRFFRPREMSKSSSYTVNRSGKKNK